MQVHGGLVDQVGSGTAAWPDRVLQPVAQVLLKRQALTRQREPVLCVAQGRRELSGDVLAGAPGEVLSLTAFERDRSAPEPAGVLVDRAFAVTAFSHRCPLSGAWSG